MPKSPEDIDFPPSEEYLKSLPLFRLQLILEASYDDLSEAEDRHKNLILFGEELFAHINQLCAQAVVDESILQQTIGFMRRNFAILDAGGMSAGRSQQYEDLSAANDRIIERIGDDQYSTIAEEYDERARG